MTALVRWVLGFMLAFLLAPRVEANIQHSAHQPVAPTFGYDSTVRRQLPLRQSMEQADCDWLRPYQGVRKTALRRGGSFADSVLKFTGKERDAETNLDYFGVRYFSGAQGRFTSPDVPLADQRPEDPQSWNLYSYGRNNPLKYVDPTGQAVELTGTEEEREEHLKALQQAIGKQAGSYLYSNAEKDKNGNATGRYFVGVLDGGLSGQGPDFASINRAASDLAGVINDKQIAQVGMVDAGEAFAYNSFTGARTMLDSNMTGLASPFNAPSPIKVWVLNPDSPYAGLPGFAMSDGNPASRSMSDTLMHELGHAAWQMDIKAGRAVPRDPFGNARALKFENDVRRLRGGATRRIH